MLASALMLLPMTAIAHADGSLETVATSKSFAELQNALEAAVTTNDMVVVTRACASCGAVKRGMTIPGYIVVDVYRNDFTVRMLEASVPAGIEAPILFYLTENNDGTTSLKYRLPSSAFASYVIEELDGIARIAGPIANRSGAMPSSRPANFDSCPPLDPVTST